MERKGGLWAKRCVGIGLYPNLCAFLFPFLFFSLNLYFTNKLCMHHFAKKKKALGDLRFSSGFLTVGSNNFVISDLLSV